jgi:hypothetical protein
MKFIASKPLNTFMALLTSSDAEYPCGFCYEAELALDLQADDINGTSTADLEEWQQERSVEILDEINKGRIAFRLGCREIQMDLANGNATFKHIYTYGPDIVEGEESWQTITKGYTLSVPSHDCKALKARGFDSQSMFLFFSLSELRDPGSPYEYGHSDNICQGDRGFPELNLIKSALGALWVDCVDRRCPGMGYSLEKICYNFHNPVALSVGGSTVQWDPSGPADALTGDSGLILEIERSYSDLALQNRELILAVEQTPTGLSHPYLFASAVTSFVAEKDLSASVQGDLPYFRRNRRIAIRQDPNADEMPSSSWWFEVGTERVFWRSESPHLFPLGKLGIEIVDDLSKALSKKDLVSGKFMATPTGPWLEGSLGDPLTVIFLVNEVFNADIPGREILTSNDAESNQPEIFFSLSAPNLSDILGPNHDETGNQILY